MEDEAVLDQLIKDDSSKRLHQPHPSGDPVTREKPYMLVHTPIPIKRAMDPKFAQGMAKKALEEEWDKLEVKRKAWLLDKVTSKAKLKD